MQLSAAGRSLILPGWGQLELGRRRGWAYVVGEAVLWTVWAERRGKGYEFRDAYRDLAWDVARERTGTRIDGAWPYYETLTKWRRSGAFDRDASRNGTQPETDPSSYNGSIWQLATGLYFPLGMPPGESDPAYQAALGYYESRAYGPAFLWDWTSHESELDEYNHLIDESDDRFRQATTAIGAVLANHLLSAVDAFLAARVPRAPRLRATPEMNTVPGRWTLEARLDAGPR